MGRWYNDQHTVTIIKRQKCGLHESTHSGFAKGVLRAWADGTNSNKS